MSGDLIERVRVRLIEGSLEGLGDYEETLARCVAIPDHWRAEAVAVVAMVQEAKTPAEKAAPALVEALQEARAALIQYAVDVEADAPTRHVLMMHRIEAALDAALNPNTGGGN